MTILRNCILPMKNEKKQTTRYFQEALSDFVYDAASGRAIRHLADTGYTTAQIVNQLDYPTPFTKVQHTVTRHFKETGILLETLPVPPASLQAVTLQRDSPEKLYALLSERIRQNGEAYSYLSCPFGIQAAGQDSKSPAMQLLSALTAREAEYIQGIAWEPAVMYHRLNRRMLEIGSQLAVYTTDIRFFFIKSREILL